MAFNDDLDQNAPNFSNIQKPPSQTNLPLDSAGDTKHNISKLAIIVTISVTLAIIVIIYLLLQKKPAPSAPVPVQQPLHGNAPIIPKR